jgi:hypothetical protein
MDHARKVAAMHRHLPTLGIDEGTYAPPLYKAMWALGLRVPPLVFAGPLHLFVVGQVVGTLLFALVFAVAPMSLDEKLAARFGFWALPLALGAIVGVACVVKLGRQFKAYGLPAWKDYRGAGSAE